LLLVTSGSLFWIVAVGPEKTAILGLDAVCCSTIPCPSFPTMVVSDLTRLYCEVIREIVPTHDLVGGLRRGAICIASRWTT
jgi:hypothetical protein